MPCHRCNNPLSSDSGLAPTAVRSPSAKRQDISDEIVHLSITQMKIRHPLMWRLEKDPQTQWRNRTVRGDRGKRWCTRRGGLLAGAKNVTIHAPCFGKSAAGGGVASFLCLREGGGDGKKNDDNPSAIHPVRGLPPAANDRMFHAISIGKILRRALTQVKWRKLPTISPDLCQK